MNDSTDSIIKETHDSLKEIQKLLKQGMGDIAKEKLNNLIDFLATQIVDWKEVIQQKMLEIIKRLIISLKTYQEIRKEQKNRRKLMRFYGHF